MAGDFWKACNEADCGLAFLIEFFLTECRRSNSVSLIERHLSATWMSTRNNSFKTALSRRLPIMIESVTMQSAASWVRGRLETRWFQVHSECVWQLWRVKVRDITGKHFGGPLNSAAVNVSALSPLNLRFPTFYRKREPLGRPPQPGTGSKRKIGRTEPTLFPRPGGGVFCIKRCPGGRRSPILFRGRAGLAHGDQLTDQGRGAPDYGQVAGAATQSRAIGLTIKLIDR